MVPLLTLVWEGRRVLETRHPGGSSQWSKGSGSRGAGATSVVVAPGSDQAPGVGLLGSSRTGIQPKRRKSVSIESAIILQGITEGAG